MCRTDSKLSMLRGGPWPHGLLFLLCIRRNMVLAIWPWQAGSTTPSPSLGSRFPIYTACAMMCYAPMSGCRTLHFWWPLQYFVAFHWGCNYFMALGLPTMSLMTLCGDSAVPKTAKTLKPKETLKKPWKIHMKVYIVKYLWGVAHLLWVLY